MNPLDVKLNLSNLHCYDEGDGIGSAEPYLWTVFFKIDGDTTLVNSGLALQGTATVVATPGNHRDLPNQSVNAGDNVPIPPVLGQFNTRLKPIPLQQPVGDVTAVGGVMGIITVLMEQDDTSDSAIAGGHNALNKAVQDGLNALIPTLTFTHQEPTDDEITAMENKIGDTVTNAIANGVGIWDWLKDFGNMDDKIGSEVFRFSHKLLEQQGVSGIGFSKRFQNEGDWELGGAVTAFPVNATTGTLHIAISGIPNNLTTSPVHVGGPGFSKGLNTSVTLTGLLPGTYTINATGFTTGRPGKPGCKAYTPNTTTRQTQVNTGQTTNISIVYTSAPCDA